MENTSIELKELVNGETTVTANFEEVKQVILQRVAGFDTMIVSDETIKAAKACRAEVKRYMDQVNQAVTRVKKQLLLPVEGFKKQADAFIAELSGYHSNLDVQIKSMEEEAREEKKKAVIAYFESVTSEEDRVNLPYSKIEDPRWYNSTTSKAAYQREIDSKVSAFKNDMAIIMAEDEVYRNAMLEAYNRTGQLSAAIAKKTELAKAIAEAEAKKKREAQEALARAEAEAARRAKEEKERQEAAAKTEEPVAPANVPPAPNPFRPQAGPVMPGGMLFGSNQKTDREPFPFPPAPTPPVMPGFMGRPSVKKEAETKEKSIDEVFAYIIGIFSGQQLNKLGIDALQQLKELQKRVAKELEK